MRIIIVPTDFSENAFNALSCAVEYFKYEITKFILIHAYADEVYKNTAIQTKENLKQKKAEKQRMYEQKLVDLKDRITDFSPNPSHDIYTLAKFGTLLNEISRVVLKENADLVLMGTQGMTADPKRTYGTNTLQVIRYVNCPVLGIPSNYKFSRPERILFPSELNLGYQCRELKMISCLANSYRSKLHLLYISNADQLSLRQVDVKEYWEYRFREREHTYLHQKSGCIPEIINRFIHDHHIDLVVMVNSTHTYLESLIHTSTIDCVGLNTAIPFLILQNLPR